MYCFHWGLSLSSAHCLLSMGSWQLESSRRLAEIQELHQSVRAAAEEARRKEEVYKQLVRPILGPRVVMVGEVWGLGSCLPCSYLGVGAGESAKRCVPAGLYPAHPGDCGQHPEAEGRDH